MRRHWSLLLAYPLMAAALSGCARKATRDDCELMAKAKVDILIAETGSVANRPGLESTLTKACLDNHFTKEHVDCVLRAKSSAESVACEMKRLDIH